MSHFAKVVDGIVTQVLVAEQDFIDNYDDGLDDGGVWIQTSYNTRGGKHYAPNTNDEDDGIALRKNFAGIGYTYDSTRDAFIPQQPYPSWTLDEDTCFWVSPVPYPSVAPDENKYYEWDESILNWKEKVFYIEEE
mgnify:CR=1 FL=1